jgi:ribonuclease HI
MTIKSQIIADFFADWGEHQYLPLAPDSTHWRMHFDGSKLLGGLGAGIVLTSPKGDKLQYVLQMHFCASNNVAEYEALVHGLKMAKQIGIRRILCFGDSTMSPERTTRKQIGCPRSAPPSRISRLGCPWRSSTSRQSNLRRNPYPSTCPETQPRLRYRHRTRGLPSRG